MDRKKSHELKLLEIDKKSGSFAKWCRTDEPDPQTLITKNYRFKCDIVNASDEARKSLSSFRCNSLDHS